MKGTVLYGPCDIRFEDRDDPKIVEPTDAILRLAATCVCGSDLGRRDAGADARKRPSNNLVPSLLACSDVLGTGWFAADAANIKPGATVVVVGDGAVGLLGILSAKQMGAGRIIAISRHDSRQKLAREFGATRPGGY